jgi:hypothetical protein
MHGYSMFLAANCNHCNGETEVIHARCCLDRSLQCQVGSERAFNGLVDRQKIAF